MSSFQVSSANSFSPLSPDYNSKSHRDQKAFERNKREALVTVKRVTASAGLKTILVSPGRGDATTQMGQFILDLQRKQRYAHKDSSVDQSAGEKDFFKLEETFKGASKSSFSISESPESTSLTKFEMNHAISTHDQTKAGVQLFNSLTDGSASASASLSAASGLGHYVDPSTVHLSYFDPRDAQYGGRMSRRINASKYYHSVPIHSTVLIERIHDHFMSPVSSMIYRYHHLLQAQAKLRSSTLNSTSSAESPSASPALIIPVFFVLMPQQSAFDYDQIQSYDCALHSWESTRFHRLLNWNQRMANQNAKQNRGIIKGLAKALGRKPSMHTPETSLDRPVDDEIPNQPPHRTVEEYEQALAKEFHYEWKAAVHNKNEKQPRYWNNWQQSPPANAVNQDGTEENEENERLRLESEAIKSEYKLIFIRAEDWMVNNPATAHFQATFMDAVAKRAELSTRQRALLNEIVSMPMTAIKFQDRKKYSLLVQYDKLTEEIREMDQKHMNILRSGESFDASSPALLSSVESAFQWIHQRLEIPQPKPSDSSDITSWKDMTADYEWIQQEKTEAELTSIAKENIQSTSFKGRITNWFKRAFNSSSSSNKSAV